MQCDFMGVQSQRLDDGLAAGTAAMLNGLQSFKSHSAAVFSTAYGSVTGVLTAP